MSAKQKREMKKQQKKQQDNDDGATEVLEENDGTEERKYKVKQLMLFLSKKSDLIC